MINDISELAMLVRRDPDCCTWAAACIMACIVAIQIAAALA